MNAGITRRAAVAAVPAIVATAALPAVSAVSTQDPHPKWWAERQACRRTISVISEEIRPLEAAGSVAEVARLDAEIDKASDRAHDLDCLIRDTEPHTTAGLAIQLQVLEAVAENFEIKPEELRRIANSAERLSGGAS